MSMQHAFGKSAAEFMPRTIFILESGRVPPTDWIANVATLRTPQPGSRATLFLRARVRSIGRSSAALELRPSLSGGGISAFLQPAWDAGVAALSDGGIE
jgi:hypothetical protein